MALRVVLVIVLAASALASPQAVLSKSMKSSLQEVASRFGMTTEDAITLTSLADPKSDILDKLEELLTQLRTEQNEADAQHQIFVTSKAQERDTLEQTLDAIRQQIQDAQNQINMNQGNIGSLSSEVSDLQSQAEEADSQVKLYEAMLDKLQREHIDNVARYADIIQKHDESLDTLQTLIDMVSNFQFNEALAVLNKQRHHFLHRKSSKVTLLVQASIELLKQEGPKNDIKQHLLELLNQIKQGTVDSRALYVEDAQNEVNSFNEESSNLMNLIANFTAQRDATLAQITDLEAQKAQEEDLLNQNQGNLDNLQTNEGNIGDSIDALDAEVALEAQTYNSETQDRVNDMNAVETAIQFVNNNVEGMSVHDLCHIGSEGCFRCLTSSDCDEDQECSDDGKCQDKPQPEQVGGTVNEHKTLTISCSGTTTISEIQFASYGMPTGTFPDFDTSKCHATSSLGVVSSRCLGQSQCSIPAENGVFGDPCIGTFKHLSVVAVCV